MFDQLLISWKQLSFTKSRFFISIVGVTFSVALMFINTGLRDGIFEDSVTIHKTLQGDLVILKNDVSNLWSIAGKTFTRRILFSVENIEGVESANPFYFNWGDFKNPTNSKEKSIAVCAFNIDKPTFNIPAIKEQTELLKKRDSFLFDRLSRPEYGAIGKLVEENGKVDIELSRHKITVDGLFALGGGILSIDGLTVTSDSNFIRLFQHKNLGEANLGLINLKPGFDPQEIKAKIASQLPRGLKIITKDEFIAKEKQYWLTNSPVGFIFSVVAVIGLIFGAIIVYQILFTQISDYLSVYATFKAIGYSNGYLMSTVLQESFMMAVLGFFPGYVICIFMYDFIENATRLPMIMNAERMIIVMVSIMVMCIFAAIGSIAKLRDADPADLFK